MNVLIDIGHPAHVHIFKHFAREMMQSGHTVLFTVREKEMNVLLLEKYGFRPVKYLRPGMGLLRKLLSMPATDYRLYRIIKDFGADITLSHSSFWLAQASRWAGIPNITLEDTGNAEQVLLYKPFTSVMMTPDCYPKGVSRKQISYAGYHELFYLHPDRFKPGGLPVFNEGSPYVLLRFSAWDASHDIGRKRISNAQKINLVKELAEKLDVFISAEGNLPIELEKHKLNVSPDEIHNVIASAELVISEGATIASEAGVLGVPCIYINPLVRCYNQDLARYGLGVNMTGFEEIIRNIRDLSDNAAVKKEWQARRKTMLADKIDPTAFLVWFVENYSDSIRIMKEDPNYQWRFK